MQDLRFDANTYTKFSNVLFEEKLSFYSSPRLMALALQKTVIFESAKYDLCGKSICLVDHVVALWN